jgi:hypothetical protein
MQAVTHIVSKIVHADKDIVGCKKAGVPFNHFRIGSETKHIHCYFFGLRNKTGVSCRCIKTKIRLFKLNFFDVHLVYKLKHGPDFFYQT